VTTKLAFRTAPGSVSIPVGTSKDLGTVEVEPFDRIRVVADERVGSAGPVVILLTITEGNELVAQLDTLTLQPKGQITRVYETPGATLTIFANATGASGSSSVDVLVYVSRYRASATTRCDQKRVFR
jgi:type III secretion protein HrpB1